MNPHTAHPLLRRVTATAAAAVMAFGGLSLATPAGAAAKAKTRKTTRKKVVAPNFTLRFIGDERTVTAGNAATYTFRMTAVGRFRSTVAFDVPDLPPGVAARIARVGGSEYRLVMDTTSAALAGSSVYGLRGRSGSLVQFANFRLTIAAAPSAPPTTAATGNFTVALTRSTLTLLPGETGALPVTINRVGFSAPVTFRLEGLPANVGAAFLPNPTQANSTLYLNPQSNAASGTYLLAITATSGGISRSTAARLDIRRVGAFGMSLSPAAISAPQGNDASTTVTLSPGPTDPIVPDVTLEVQGAPGGVTVLNPVTTGRSTKFTLRTSTATAPGTYNLTVVGRSGTFTQTARLQMTVQSNVPGFGFSATPITQTIDRGSVATYTVTTSTTGGFNSPISYSAEGLPAGATLSVEPTSSGAVLRITTAATTAPTTYDVQLTGRSGTLTATVPVKMVVTAPATAPATSPATTPATTGTTTVGTASTTTIKA